MYGYLSQRGRWLQVKVSASVDTGCRVRVFQPAWTLAAGVGGRWLQVWKLIKRFQSGELWKCKVGKFGKVLGGEDLLL